MSNDPREICSISPADPVNTQHEPPPFFLVQNFHAAVSTRASRASVKERSHVAPRNSCVLSLTIPILLAPQRQLPGSFSSTLLLSPLPAFVWFLKAKLGGAACPFFPRKLSPPRPTVFGHSCSLRISFPASFHPCEFLLLQKLHPPALLSPPPPFSG